MKGVSCILHSVSYILFVIYYTKLLTESQENSEFFWKGLTRFCSHRGHRGHGGKSSCRVAALPHRLFCWRFRIVEYIGNESTYSRRPSVESLSPSKPSPWRRRNGNAAAPWLRIMPATVRSCTVERPAGTGDKKRMSKDQSRVISELAMKNSSQFKMWPHRILLWNLQVRN